MDSFEFFVDHERFQVDDRCDLGGRISYDFAWLNGPADGTYGFTVSPVAVGPEAGSNSIAEMSEEQLVKIARTFITGFYEDGGIGGADFPDHERAGPPKQ